MFKRLLLEGNLNNIWNSVPTSETKVVRRRPSVECCKYRRPCVHSLREITVGSFGN
jgi:hypothetical protein